MDHPGERADARDGEDPARTAAVAAMVEKLSREVPLAKLIGQAPVFLSLVQQIALVVTLPCARL